MKSDWKSLTSIMNDELGKIAKMSYLTDIVFGKYVKGLLIESEYGPILIDKSDYGVGLELRNSGCYGRSEVRNIEKFINGSSIVLVVGAHIGALVIPLAKRCSRVVAIEPNKSSYDLLSQNILLNELHNCEIHNIAASDKIEKIAFLHNTANSGGSKRKPILENYFYTYDLPNESMVNAEPLDLYLTENKFDLILMDLEGSEYYALKGMPLIIENAKVVIIEFIPHHLRNVSGVSVDEFLKLLMSFDILTIPSRNLTVSNNNFSAVLNYMFENNLSDNGIIFERNSTLNSE